MMKMNIRLKNIKPLLSIIFMLLFTQVVKAQFPVDGPYQSIAPPATPAMPDYGQSVIDYSVPSPIEITRITELFNYVDGNGDPQVWYPTHEYAKTQVWNADQTMYKMSSWKIYDATTYQEIHELSGMYSSYWSNTDSDLIWSFRENGDVKKHIVSTNTTETVATITPPDGGEYEFVKLGPGEGNIDKFDHYVALVGKAGIDLDVIIFDLQTNQVVLTETIEGAWGAGGANFPDYIDWISISQSGDYVVIMWNHNTSSEDNPCNGHYGVEVYDRVNMQYLRRIIKYGNHGDLGYAIDGDEVLVQFYGLGSDRLYMHKLNGEGTTVLSSDPDIGVTGHISCRNINRPGWAYVTISELDDSAQMIAVKLDDSGIVEHFGHHFSSALSYDQASMAVASPNGDEICFKSDFGTDPVSGSELAYSFFATLANPVSVEDEQWTSINIYPNPANGIIRIESENSIKRIAIYNDIGELVKGLENVNSKVVSVSMADLKGGFYFVNISTDEGSTFRKIVKE